MLATVLSNNEYILKAPVTITLSQQYQYKKDTFCLIIVKEFQGENNQVFILQGASVRTTVYTKINAMDPDDGQGGAVSYHMTVS